MDEFKKSIKKIRRIFVIISILYFALIVVVGGIGFISIENEYNSNFAAGNSYDSDSYNPTAGFTAVVGGFSALFALTLGLFVLIMFLLIGEAIIWGIFAIIYFVKKNKYNKNYS